MSYYNNKKTDLNDLTKRHLTYSERATLSDNLAAIERDREYQEKLRRGNYNFFDKIYITYALIVFLFSIFSILKYYI